MRTLESESYVLRVSDLQEADRVVAFLSRDHGIKRGAARGAKRRFSRFAGELQPLARGRIRWFEKSGRELVRIESVELSRAPKRLGADLEGILLGAYIGETMEVFTQEGESAETPFRLLDSVVDALEGGVERELAARYFESWMLRLAGVFPRPEDCPHCGAPLDSGAALAPSGEALLCRRCAGENPGALPVSSGALDFWRRIGRESLSTMADRPPGAAVLAEVEEVAGRIRRHFLQGEIRSYQVLRRTLAGLARMETPEKR